MARAIDADYLMERLNKKKAGPANKRYTEGFNDCLMRVRSMVHSMPTLTPPNEPLTIEQLREMDGEPVWCKWLLPEDRAIEQGKWFIVISGDKAGLEIKRPAEYGCHFCKIDDYGKTWLAYRRPPEGEANA